MVYTKKEAVQKLWGRQIRLQYEVSSLWPLNEILQAS